MQLQSVAWLLYWRSVHLVSLVPAPSMPSSFCDLFVVTSLAAGRVGDTLGRKGTLFVGAVIFAIGGGIQTLATGFWVMVIGRIVAGFGVGLLS